MTDSRLELVLRRDRRVVLTAIIVVTASAMVYVWMLAASMRAMDMTGMDIDGMPPMLAPTFAPWSAGQGMLTFIMWAVMMVGMMTPSAAPMLLLYARVGRQARQNAYPFAATGWFAAGYLLMWFGFALIATALQWLLERAALLTPMLASSSHVFGAVVLIAAGGYQWLAVKDRCLSQCQSPLAFIQQHGGFSATPCGALRLGIRHGLYCVGCCWALMMLLFVGGVMNTLWIAALSLLVLLEKLAPLGRLIPRLAGVILISLGLCMLFN
jgi:predicted metal-binding membrane protein